MGFLDNFLESAGKGIGAGLGGGIIGTGMGLLLEGHEDERQRKQNQALLDQQTKAAQGMGLFNYDLQNRWANEHSYNWQMNKLKEAGLNPGLMYGEGGGGVTQAPTVGAEGVNAGNGTKTGGEAMGMGLQMAQIQAQVRLAEAQEKNIEADTENKKAQNPNITTDTNLKQSQIDLNKIEAQFQNESFNNRLATIEETMQNINSQTRNNEQQFNFNEATWKQRVEQEGMKVAEIAAKVTLMQADTTLTEQKALEVIQNIKTQIKQLQQGDQQIEIQKVRNDLIKTGMWVGAGTAVLGDIIKLISKPAQVAEKITEIFDDGQGNKTISTRHNK